MTIQSTSNKLSMIVETLLQHYVSDIESDSYQNEIWQQTPSLFELCTVASIPKIYIKYYNFEPLYYGKQFIVYHTLCKRLMCPIKKTANIIVKSSQFKCSCIMHIKQFKYKIVYITGGWQLWPYIFICKTSNSPYTNAYNKYLNNLKLLSRWYKQST